MSIESDLQIALLPVLTLNKHIHELLLKIFHIFVSELAAALNYVQLIY